MRACVDRERHMPARADQNTIKRWSHLFSEVACKTAHLTGKPLDVSDRRSPGRGLGLHRSAVPLQRHLATGDQHVDDDRDVPDGVPASSTPRIATRWRFSSSYAEFIIAVRGAENRLAAAEDLSEDDLERLHEEYRVRADETLDHLEQRRGRTQRAS